MHNRDPHCGGRVGTSRRTATSRFLGLAYTALLFAGSQNLFLAHRDANTGEAKVEESERFTEA